MQTDEGRIKRALMRARIIVSQKVTVLAWYAF